MGSEPRPGRSGGTDAPVRLGLINGLAILLLLLTWSGVGGTLLGAAGEGRVDFFTFLDSAEQFRRGLPLYEPVRRIAGPGGEELAHPNLNHPAMILLLLPLTWLARRDAFLLWTAVGLGAYLAAVVLAFRATRLPLRGPYGPATIALILTFPGAIYSLQLGQLGLLLALPVVGVWILLRSGTRSGPSGHGPWRPLVAAAAIGVLVALKPFLFPTLALFLRRRCWGSLLVAGAGAGGVSLLTLPFTGAGAYRDWAAAVRTVSWYDHGMNISLTGLLYRVVDPAPPVLLTGVLALAAALAGLLVIRRPPRSQGKVDRDVGVLLVLAILGSPLGWLYYTPLLIPALVPLVAAWPGLPPLPRRTMVGGFALLWIPPIALPLLPTALWAQLSLRTTATYGLVLLALVLDGVGDTARASTGTGPGDAPTTPPADPARRPPVRAWSPRSPRRPRAGWSSRSAGSTPTRAGWRR